MMDMYKDQLGMAKEQWAVTKEELDRVRKVRENLTAQYGRQG